MTRIHEREYGPVSYAIPEEVYQSPPPFASVSLSTLLGSFFTTQMKSASRVRGGLLFGRSKDEVLQLMVASTAGIPSWYTPGSRAVLDVDARFAFGWSEALRAAFGGRISWVGNWVVHPDGQLKSQARDLRQFRDAFRSGLVDDRHVLLVLGWNDGVLKTHIYRKEFENAPEALDSTGFSIDINDLI